MMSRSLLRSALVLVAAVVVAGPGFFSSVIRADSAVRGPPLIQGNTISEYLHKVEETVKLECPIDAQPTPIYEWFKEDERREKVPITEAWDKRYRVKGKTLKIRGVTAEDGGVYVCKAVNGFGRKEYGMRLQVQDEKGEVIGGMAEDEDVIGSRSDEHDDLPDGVLGIMPKIVDMSRPTVGHLFRPVVGTSLTLYCKAEGQPHPLVSWYKVKERSQAAIATGQERLVFKSVKLEDTGTYVCVAGNEFGHVNATFPVTVIERSLWDPKIIRVEPTSNLTVALGREMQFRCYVKSDLVPEIKWYREIKATEHKLGPLDYQLMNGTQSLSHASNGTFISEIIWKIDRRDSGMYVCTVPNDSKSKIHKAVTLNVLPDTGAGEDFFLPTGALIAIPSTLAVLFIALTLVVCCVRRTQGVDTSSGTMTITTTYASPRDVIHDHHNHHHRHMINGGSIPYYNTRSSAGHQGGPPPPHPPCLGMMGNGGRATTIPTHLNNGSHHGYYCKENQSPSGIKSFSPNNGNSAYASVPICENAAPPPISTFAPSSRAPPLPSRPNFPPCNRDRNNYNQGLLTQPLLTQTASSSDSRDSRQSGGGGGRNDYNPHRQVDQWSAGSDASSERKNSRGHHIRL